MGFNRENYRRIKEEYDGKYLRAQEAARFRRAEIHASLPEVEEIDRDLSSMGFRIFDATIKNDKALLDSIEAETRELSQKRAEIMVAAGFPADYTEIRYECELCGDTGVVDYRMCKCMKDKLIKAGLESSGMYELIKSQTFDNFDLGYYTGEAHTRMKAILEIAKKYADEFDASSSGSIIMHGNTGLGKTHLSSAMGGVIIEKGNDVYYTSAVDMFADFENDRFHSSYQESGNELDKYFSCDLLIIDDLGTEMVNQFTTSCLYNVINSRLVKKKATIINTNFTRDEIKAKYTERISSRIFGEYQSLPFLGNDIRIEKLKK